VQELSARYPTMNLAGAERALQRIANRWCANADDARDLVQDTFERALRSGIWEDIRSLDAWLARIMHNVFINRCRTAARRPSLETLDDNQGYPVRDEPGAPEPDTPEPAWSRITVQDVHEALDQIEPMYREVYKLHAFDHLTYEQIAERLSIGRITVGTRLTRARKHLREVLVRRFGLEMQS
jgi:RNA polymerase sigma-70 factor, ECF subfamily